MKNGNGKKKITGTFAHDAVCAISKIIHFPAFNWTGSPVYKRVIHKLKIVTNFANLNINYGVEIMLIYRPLFICWGNQFFFGLEGLKVHIGKHEKCKRIYKKDSMWPIKFVLCYIIINVFKFNSNIKVFMQYKGFYAFLALCTKE